MVPKLPIDALRIRGARDDLKQAFDIDTPHGREGLFWWFFRRGHREVPVAGTDDLELINFINAPQPGIKRLGFLPVTRLMTQLWVGSAPGRSGLTPIRRSGLLRIIDLLTVRRHREAQEAVLRWYFLEEIVEANLESLLDQAQAEALLAADRDGTTRIEKMIWRHDATCRDGFKGPRDRQFRNWIRSAGSRKYRLLSHPKIGLAAPPRAPARPLSKGSLPFGVNLYGHAGARLGIGEDVRMAALSLRTAGVPFTLHSVRATDLPDVEQLPAPGGPACDYAINIFCMSGLDTFQLAQRKDRLFDGHFNIGFWPWELPDWPAVLRGCFDLVDEIWTSSRFTSEAFRKSAPNPVRHLPMSVTVTETEGYGRADFGLADERFYFGTAFDGNSGFARKNPLAVIRAFQSAFPDDASAGLVLKGLRVEGSDEWREVERACGDDRRIRLLAGSYPRGQLLDLYRNIDAFISLHRSEGFGRNIAEAMLLGKPVIASHYSGNLEFTTPENTLLVDTPMVPVLSGEYPWAEGLEWGNPDIAAAASAMTSIKKDAEMRLRLAMAGQRTVAKKFNPDEVGRKYRLVLERIFAEGATMKSIEGGK